MATVNQGKTFQKRAADVAPGVVGVQPSTVGSSRAAAEGKRAANAGSSRRSLKYNGISKETGFKVTKFLGQTSAVIDTIVAAKKGLDTVEGTEMSNSEFAQECARLLEKAPQAIRALLERGAELLARIQSEQAASRDAEYEHPDASGATGEVPHSGARAGMDDAELIRRGTAKRKVVDEALKRSVTQNQIRNVWGLPDVCDYDPYASMAKIVGSEVTEPRAEPERRGTSIKQLLAKAAK